MEFDPFKSGAAVETVDKPSASGQPTEFDPFSTGQAEAHVPYVEKEQNSAPQVGTDWPNLYAGLDGMDGRLHPDQRKVFQRLDSLTDNSKQARAEAVNQSYLSTQLKDISHSQMERDWPAIKLAYAKDQFGVVDSDIPDTKLYSLIANKLTEDPKKEKLLKEAAAKEFNEGGMAHGMAMVAHAFLPKFSEETMKWWVNANKPLVGLPEAPKDMPDIPALGLTNPALVGGVWNGIKPLIEGVETPLSLGTIGAGAALKDASVAYPIARKALGGMVGLFTGLMGIGTVKSTMKVPGIMKNPNATFQDKITAWTEPVAEAGATVLGAVGTAMELMPPEQATAVTSALNKKNPAQAAGIFRHEAANVDIPGLKESLVKAADEMDKIAPAKTPKGDLVAGAAIKASDGTIHTGTEHADIPVQGEFGFVTKGGQFLDKKEAMQVAKENGQIGPEDAAKDSLSSDMLKKKEAPKTPKVEETPPKAAESPEIGIKNEAVDAQLNKMGIEEGKHGEPTTDEADFAEAKARTEADPMAGQKLVDELTEKVRPVDKVEVAMIAREAVRTSLERDAAEMRKDAAIDAGDPDAIATASLDVARARDAYEKTLRASDVAGTSQAQAFRIRQRMLKEDYSLAAIERRRKVAAGKPLTEEQLSQAKADYEELQTARAKIEAYDKAQAEAKANPVKEAPRRPRPTSRVSEFITKQSEAARGRLAAKFQKAAGASFVEGENVGDLFSKETLQDLAIVGADHVAKGLTKFADWSVAMVNEFGDKIKPHLQDIFKQAIEARDQARKLQAYKTRTKTETAKAQKKLDIGDFTKEERKKIELDPEAKRLKTEYERVKRKVQLGELKLEQENRTPMETARTLFQKWVRFGALSYPTVFAKLTSAAIARIVSTPLEQLVGLGVSKLLPELAERARAESVPTFSGLVRSESKAITEGLTTGIKGAFDMLMNRDSDTAALLEKEHLPPDFVEYLGKLHGAFKEPVKTADFARRLQLLTEKDIRAGIDVTQPVEQMRLMNEAYTYAKRSIFMQDNGLVNAYKMAIRGLEAKQKATGKPSAALQLLSTVIQSELPVVKVPTNVIAEINEAISGSVLGPVKAAWAYAKGIEELSPGEADAILRLMKKGSIGATFLALGYFKSKQFGGFHQTGEQRKPNELQAGEAKAGNTTIPKALLHNPYAEVMQYGATVRKVSDSLIHKAGGDNKGPLVGILGATIGLYDEVPFVRETTTFGRYADSRQFLSAADAKAASILIPGIVQWTAGQLDKKTPFSPMETPTPRKAENLKETIQKGVPGLRQELPKRATHK